MTGEGMDKLIEAAELAREAYEKDYKPELERRKVKRAEEDALRKQTELKKFEKDVELSKGKEVLSTEMPEEEEEEEDERENYFEEEDEDDEWGRQQDGSEDSDEDDYGW